MSKDDTDILKLPDTERRNFMVLETNDQRLSLYHPTRKEILRALSIGYEDFETETKVKEQRLDDGTVITEEVRIQRPSTRYWLNAHEILKIISKNTPELDISIYNCYYHLRKLQEEGFVEQYPPVEEDDDGGSRRVRGMYFRTVAKFFAPTTFEISPEMHQKDVLPPEISAKAVELAQKVKNTGTPDEFEYSLDIDGEKYWFSVTMSLHDDGESIVSVVRDITKERQASEALKVSQERLDLAIKGANLAPWDMNLNPRFMIFSEPYAEMLGYSLDELETYSKHIEDLIHPDDLKGFEDTWSQHLSGKLVVFSSEHRLKHKSGSYIWVLDRGRIMEWDEDGTPKRAAGTLLDITGEKLVMEALDKSEERYRRLVEESVQGIVILQDEKVVFANPAYAETVGRSIEELLKFTPDETWELIYPDDRESLRIRNEDFASGLNRLPSHRFRYLRPDGEIRWVQSYANRILHDGKPAIQALEVDITQQMRIEEALAERENLFRGVFETAQVGILLFDVNGRIQRFNPAAGNILGVESETDFEDYTIMDDPNIPDWVLEDVREFAPANFETIYDINKTKIKSSKKNTIYLKVSGSVWNLQDDNKSGVFVVIIEDITERKRTENALLDSEEKYRTLVESISQPLVILQGDPPSVVYVNEATSKIIGYTSEELYQMGPGWVPKIFHPRSIEYTAETLYDILTERLGPNIHGYEDQFIHKNGKILSLVSHPTRIMYNGQPALQVLLIDVTSQREMTSALMEGDEQYKTYFYASEESLLLISDGKITDCNKTAANLLECKNFDAVIGKTLSQISPSKQHDGETSKSKEAALLGSVSSSHSLTLRWRFKSCKGNSLDCELNLKNVKLQSGTACQLQLRKID